MNTNLPMLALLRKFRRWTVSIARWMWELRVTWLCLVGAIAVIAGSLALPKLHADGLRYAGLVLQLAGILAVLFDLRNRGQLFDRPSISRFMSAWLARRPLFTPKPIDLQATITTSVSSSATFGNLIAEGYKADDPVEVKVAALAKTIDVMQKAMQQQETRLSGAISEVAEQLNREGRARTSEIQTVTQKLAVLGAGSLELELAGIVLLVLGVILATIPAEIVSMFSWAT